MLSSTVEKMKLKLGAQGEILFAHTWTLNQNELRKVTLTDTATFRCCWCLCSLSDRVYSGQPQFELSLIIFRSMRYGSGCAVILVRLGLFLFFYKLIYRCFLQVGFSQVCLKTFIQENKSHPIQVNEKFIQT